MNLDELKDYMDSSADRSFSETMHVLNSVGADVLEEYIKQIDRKKLEKISLRLLFIFDLFGKAIDEWVKD